MPREIWSEGRVTGLSAYEVYVKQHLSEDPDTPPATEREWLASSIAMGSSMLLQVPNTASSVNAGDHTLLQIPLPVDSKLAAANTIIAQFFDGDIDSSAVTNNWVTRVTDYGTLISNTSTSAPSGDISAVDNSNTTKVPTGTLENWNTTKRAQLADYLKIVDGLVLQPGTWSEADSEVQPPQNDFSANLRGGAYPTIRLHVTGTITTNPIILLTGFTLRSVLTGISGTDTALDTESPQDGDFLGPAVFPWAAKIVFTVPNSYVNYFATSGYSRELKTPSASTLEPPALKDIKDTAVIDMQGSKPETFYSPTGYDARAERFSPNPHNPRYAYKVRSFSTLGDIPIDGEAILTTYQRNPIYPPALYGTFVSNTDDAQDSWHYLNPLDVTAPGTVKMMSNQGVTGLYIYEATFPGTHAISRRPDGVLQMIVKVQEGQPYTSEMQYDLYSVADVDRYYLYNTYHYSSTEDKTAVDSDATVDTEVFTAPGFDYNTGYVDSLAGAARPLVVRTNTGTKSAITLMLDTDVRDLTQDLPDRKILGINISPNPYTINSSIKLTASNSNNDLSWAALLNALRNNRAIDILGTRLKSAKDSLLYNHYGSGPYIEFGPDFAYEYDSHTTYNSGQYVLHSYSGVTNLYQCNSNNVTGPWDSSKWTSKVYDSTATYNVGDYVSYQNCTYRCKTNNTTGTWNLNNWIATKVRLYISMSAPDLTDVPEGSIGIGWGFLS